MGCNLNVATVFPCLRVGRCKLWVSLERPCNARQLFLHRVGRHRPTSNKAAHFGLGRCESHIQLGFPGRYESHIHFTSMFPNLTSILPWKMDVNWMLGGGREMEEHQTYIHSACKDGCKMDVGRGSGNGRPLHIHFRTAPNMNVQFCAHFAGLPIKSGKGEGGTLWSRLTSQASHSSSLPATSYHVCSLMPPEQKAA